MPKLNLTTDDELAASISAAITAATPAGGFAGGTQLASEVTARTNGDAGLDTRLQAAETTLTARTAGVTASTIVARDANGDTSLRKLNLTTDPASNNEAVRKSWADTQLAAKVSTSLLGATSGVATLGVDGKLTAAQLPALAINETFVVASQSAMLALTAERGDVAVRTDFTPSRLFILTADAPTTLANWREITAAGAVTSVDGQSGTVTLGAVAATADTLARRTSAGRLIAVDATSANELTTKGQVDTALALKESITNVDAVRTRLSALDTDGFTAYTPAWLAGGSAVTLGNGTLVGRFKRGGKIVFLVVIALGGSTTNGGSGTMTFSLPSALPASTVAEQAIISKMFVAGIGNFHGFGNIASAGTLITPYVSKAHNDTRPEPIQNLAAGSSDVATARPQVNLLGGDYPMKNGSNIVLQGWYETSAA